jgi:hypothetical protein
MDRVLDEQRRAMTSVSANAIREEAGRLAAVNIGRSMIF